MIKRVAILLLTALALAARAQDTNQFRATSGTVDLIEGGRVSVVKIDWGDLRCSIRNPIRFAAHVDSDLRQIKFDTDSGAVVIEVTFTTNSPGVLPANDDLQAMAAARHPGAWVLGTGTLYTGYQPGVYIDMAARPSALLSLRIRQGFVATPKGIVEFSFGANDAEFEKYRVAFMQAAGTLTVETIKPKAEGQ